MTNDKQREWVEDFNSLFGEVERSENIRVFIKDLLDKTRKEVAREIFQVMGEEATLNSHVTLIKRCKKRYLKD